MTDSIITDADGDALELGQDVQTTGPHLWLRTPQLGVTLDHARALELYHELGNWLMATDADATTADEQPDAAYDVPDAERDGYSWGVDSVALDAHTAVYGDRQASYGHPRDDFMRQGMIWTALLAHKLIPGEHIEPADVGRCMVGVKLARDVHSPKRDNRVDGCGYFVTLDRLETGE